MTVTEKIDPAMAEKHIFKRFRWRLLEVAAKKGKITTLKEAKKRLNEQKQVEAPQAAAKRWCKAFCYPWHGQHQEVQA